MTKIETIEQLQAIYGVAAPAALVKVADHLTDDYGRYMAAAPFAALATMGPEGLDCSPRGDGPGFVVPLDPKTLAMPDRRGNNRIDSLRNIVRDPKVALLFLIPGLGNTLRVNGRAHISVEPDLLARFAVDGHAPRTVIVIKVQEVYFQCARAIIRADLWNPARHASPADFPSAGEILAHMSENKVGGPDYDRAWPERARQTMW
jgi:PPOX class probable FMN-dependent enzyme